MDVVESKWKWLSAPSMYHTYCNCTVAEAHSVASQAIFIYSVFLCFCEGSFPGTIVAPHQTLLACPGNQQIREDMTR